MIDSLLQSVTAVAPPVTAAVVETSPEPSPIKSPSRPVSASAPVRPMAPLPRPCPTEVAAGLLEDDTGRALLVRDRFAEADGDSSGKPDTDECVTLIGTLCADVGLAPPRDEKVAQLFAMCDDDNSGQLDLAQFEAFFKVVLRDAAKRAAKLGKTDCQKKLAA